MISVSDPYGMIASDIVLTLLWRRVVIIIIQTHSAKDSNLTHTRSRRSYKDGCLKGLYEGENKENDHTCYA